MKLLGQDVIFSLAGETVAFATSCEIGADTDFIEVCSPVSGADKEYLPTTFGWSLSGNYLCANLADKARLIELQRANTKFEVRIFDRELSTVLRGYCYIKSLQLSASKGSLAKFAATYQPTGGLEKVEAVEVPIDWHFFRIEDVNFEKNINHALKYEKSADMRVWVFNIAQRARVWINATQIDTNGIASILPLPEDKEDGILDAIGDRDNLRFFNMEIAHLGDGALGFEQSVEMMMQPGRYAVLVEGHANMNMEVKALYSLPATN